MANPVNKPATSLQGLERFGGQVFENSQGKYTLDEFMYVDDLSLFSTAFFTTTAANAIPVGSSQDLFVTPFGQAGQGFVPALGVGPTGNAALQLSETNVQNGQAGAKFQQNQSYIAVAGGFEVYCIPANAQGIFVQTGGIPIPGAPDLFQIVSSATWSWNVGGLQSPTLVYEPIRMWPIGAGITGIGAAGAVNAMSNGGPVSTMRKFALPLMFPPNIAAQCRLTFSRGVTNIASLNAGSVIAIAFHLRGYTLTKTI
jgi:hypothetical protein